MLPGCPMCLTGLGENVAMGVDKCKWVDERQLVEVGNFFPDEDGLGKYTLRPLGRRSHQLSLVKLPKVRQRHFITDTSSFLSKQKNSLSLLHRHWRVAGKARWSQK